MTGTAAPGPDVVTIGHSTHEADAFVALLGEHGVALLADVRRYPGSRRVPWTNRPLLERRLAEAGIGYLHLEALGGRRTPVEGSTNGGWRVRQFQGYADHMGTEEFARGLAALEARAREAPAAVMCAEAQWWRCHRRMVADALVVRGWGVRHADGRGGAEPHALTSFAVVADGVLRYPG
jgi:uncharacterized protein (DUF488 family)